MDISNPMIGKGVFEVFKTKGLDAILVRPVALRVFICWRKWRVFWNQETKANVFETFFPPWRGYLISPPLIGPIFAEIDGRNPV